MQSTRDRLLDAATDAVVAGTEWRRVRMADVAHAAGVSRQTLYYEFGSRDALAQALALREAARYTEGAQAAMDACDGTLGQVVAAGARYTLTVAAGHPLVKAVLTDDTASLLPLLTSRAEPLLAQTGEHSARYLSARWPELPVDLVRLVAETVDRLVLSYVVLPGGLPDEVAARITQIVDALLPRGTTR